MHAQLERETKNPKNSSFRTVFEMIASSQSGYFTHVLTILNVPSSHQTYQQPDT